MTSSFFAVTWNFDVAVGDLGFNLMYPPYVPVEYTAHTEGTVVFTIKRSQAKGYIVYFGIRSIKTIYIQLQ